MNNKDILKFKLTEKIPKLDPDIFKFFERMFLKVLETKIEVENAKFNKEDIPEDLLSVLIKSLLNDFDMMGFSEVKHQDEIILNEYRKNI